MCEECVAWLKKLRAPRIMPVYILPDKLFQQPLTYVCEYKGKEGEGIDFSLSENDPEWEKVYAYGGIRMWNRATIHLLSPYVLGWNAPPADELRVKSVDLDNRIMVVEYKANTNERTAFPPETQAIIVDTDKPLADHFVDNMCSFCTGLWGRSSEETWVRRFYDEMNIEWPNGKNSIVRSNGPYSQYTWANPFAKHSRVVHQGGRLVPCLPWPTPPYLSNGRGDIATDKGYKWPAYMSVAFLFSKKVHYLLYEIISARSKEFCKLYPLVIGGHAQVTRIRQVELDIFQFWRDFDARSPETKVKWNE